MVKFELVEMELASNAIYVSFHSILRQYLLPRVRAQSYICDSNITETVGLSMEKSSI